MTGIDPYYQDDFVTLYHADVRDLWDWKFVHCQKSVVITDPPYPNNAGHFTEAVGVAEDVLHVCDVETITFWNELERPYVPLPLVAIHIWNRANVNGRPYESAYHFAFGGKRRSEVFHHAVEFENATGAEYLGHPARKPVALMQRLIQKTDLAVVLDPFCGVGSTLRAAKNLGRKAIGIEIEERYCQIAAERCAQEVLVTRSTRRWV